MSALTSASGRRLSLGRLSPAAGLVLLIGATLLARLVVAALVPLTADEAYYRLWSLKPAFGYFDHPPMIAWWIWLGRHLAGDTPLGVRLVPTLSVAVTTLLTYDLARQAEFSERTAVRAAVWLNATLLIGLGGEMAVPDAPNALFFTAALCCAFRAMKGRPSWWLAAGAAAGLGCLSKYSALFLAPGVLLWLAATRDGRKALATPWPWLAAVVAVAFYAPNVAWNAEHGWLTFIKQFGRVRPTGLELKYLVKFPVDQFFLLNPLIAVFVVRAVRRRTTPRLLLVCAPFVGYLVIHSLHGEVQGQWPAPLYPALAIAAAAAAEDAKGWLASLRTAAAPVGFGVCAATFAFMIAPSPAWLPMRDPARAVRGWPAFLGGVEAERLAAGAAWVGAPNYGLAAQFADAPQIHAPATEIFERQRFTFEVPAERADFARPGLVVADVRDGVEGAVRRCFANVTPLGDLKRGEGRGSTLYALYRVARPRVDVETAGCEAAAPKR